MLEQKVIIKCVNKVSYVWSKGMISKNSLLHPVSFFFNCPANKSKVIKTQQPYNI